MTLPPDEHKTAATEAALLGGLLRYPNEIGDVRDRLRPDDLYWDHHQRIYRAILDLADRRAPIDLVAIDNELRDSDVRDKLAELWEQATSNVGYHADLVLDLSLARGIRHAAVETLGHVSKPTGPASELLEAAQGRFDALSQRVTGTASVHVADAIDDLLAEIDARSRGDRLPGQSTGINSLDEILGGGLLIGGLTILAARPSVGKTSLALQIARNVAKRDRAVYVASLEQPQRELTERLMAAEASVNGQAIRKGQLTADETERLMAAAQATRSWNLRINDKPAQTAGHIAAGARRARRSLHGLDLIVVDYLDLVSPDDAKATRNEQVGRSCRRLREMARELGVPALVCCQLNREAEHDVAPRLSHLRNSGEIEQHADAVLFLHRAKMRALDEHDNLELHVAKQRNGPLGLVRLEHRSERFQFEETWL